MTTLMFYKNLQGPSYLKIDPKLKTCRGLYILLINDWSIIHTVQFEKIGQGYHKETWKTLW